MKKQKMQRRLLIITGVLLIVQIPWYAAVQILVNKTEVRTTATVVSIDHKSAGCIGDSIEGYDTTCDHSNRLYPIYEYFDQNGHRYEQDDQFFGEYKANNPLGKLFLKHVGDKVTAYYTKNKPEEVLFMASPFAYTAWLIPLYSAALLSAFWLVILVLHRSKNYFTYRSVDHRE